APAVRDVRNAPAEQGENPGRLERTEPREQAGQDGRAARTRQPGAAEPAAGGAGDRAGDGA
ncbi:hypothetical protein, partial [Streptomyces nanshensis]|uniref:hypothetical protein n=1 Tax=Streptomyces nanshensis TaxID=518642 RepID=UPI001C0C23F2